MRILQIIPDLAIGGAERLVVQLAVEQQAQGHDVHLVTLYGSRDNHNKTYLEDHKISVTHLGKSTGLDVRLSIKLQRLIASLGPDVIHTHQYSIKYVLPEVLRAQRVMLHTVHSLPEKELTKRDRVIQRLAYKRGVIPVAVADEVARGIQRLYHMRAPVVPNGVNVDRLHAGGANRVETRGREGWAHDHVVVLSVARLSAPKDHSTLLRAFALAQASQPTLRLSLAGDGVLRPELEALAAELGIQQWVQFLGVRSDIEQLFGGADASVLSSNYEGNPLSVMEAMAAGRAVVASNVGGISELICHNVNGLLFEAGNVGMLAGQLERLTYADERQRLGAAAHQTARARFSISAMARAYIELYGQTHQRVCSD